MTEEKITKNEQKADLQPGEKVFTIVLFLLCCAMLYYSALLWMEHPYITGPATVPLITSAFPAILLLLSIISNLKKRTPLDFGALDFGEKMRKLKEYLFPNSIIVALIFVLGYCVALYVEIPFYISTSIFLWGLISLLCKKGYVRNAIYTAITMAFIAVVFGMIFNVVMP